jgi:exodeoxyribonuclease-5
MNFFQLSPDQHAAIKGICTTLVESDPGKHALAVLTGSAGTGKSTTVIELLVEINKYTPTPNIELCATTHRAASVLSDMTGHSVKTAYALFKLRPSVNKYGKETLVRAGNCEIPNGSIIIIDESSMIGNDFLKAIVETVKKRSLKVLFVGDPFQLPPMSDTCSLFDGSLPTYILSYVHRQALDNPILSKAVEFREFVEGIRSSEPLLETDLNQAGKGIHVLSHNDFISKFVQKYVGYKTGAVVDIPLCTFTNESAINYNNIIRKATYFLDGSIAPFYEGERLVSNSIVKHGDKTILVNNESVVVLSYREWELNDIPGYQIRVRGDFDNGVKSDIKTVFSPLNKAAADKVLNAFKKEAIESKSKSNWIEYYDLKTHLADLRAPFAGTTHKAQGGTFPSVFIDIVNIRKCRDISVRARLMYVALTRASNNVYINS